MALLTSDDILVGGIARQHLVLSFAFLAFCLRRKVDTPIARYFGEIEVVEGTKIKREKGERSVKSDRSWCGSGSLGLSFKLLHLPTPLSLI